MVNYAHKAAALCVGVFGFENPSDNNLLLSGCLTMIVIGFGLHNTLSFRHVIRRYYGPEFLA